jgi:putative transport protein
MIKLLIDNPMLLLFSVIAIGYPVGRIRIRGVNLGLAAVLFVGIAVGALHPDLKLPEIVYVLGLALFVYTIGIGSGPGFFASFRRKGLRDNLLVVGLLAIAALIAYGAHLILRLPPTLTAGMFAGSLTNTPALAGVLESVKSLAPAAALDTWLAEPVIAYSVTYPMGVVGMILAIALLQRLWKIDYMAEAKNLRALGMAHRPLENRTIFVTREDADQLTVRELMAQHKWDVIFSRWKHGPEVTLVSDKTRLANGDLVSVVGVLEEIEKVTAFLGKDSPAELVSDRSEFDYRRIFVSNPKVAGMQLKDLGLPHTLGAVVTRVRRGDIDLLPHGDMTLELGDRVRVLTRRERLDAVSAYFGDSYRALSEIDILTFSLGLTLGILLGIVPIPLGPVTLKLGLAGGPLIVALILGALGRTGPLVWSLPYSANLTLRQIGLVLFLAGIGTRAGYSFWSTFTSGGGLSIFVGGAVITCSVALITLWVAHRLLKIPMGLAIGMLAGLQTQPAVLGFALEQTGNDSPNLGYAMVYPVAMITKILLAQLLLTLAR